MHPCTSTAALQYIMMRRGRETEDEKGEGLLYALLLTGVVPTMITNQCYFSQVQAGEGKKTSHGGNQRLSYFSWRREVGQK